MDFILSDENNISLNYFLSLNFSEHSKLIELEEAAKAGGKGKWAKDASEVMCRVL